MVKITIGVPVYNSEKYIRQGLDSFVKQTMNKDEFEVLCVDDCSSDNSLEVINSYKDKLNLSVIKLPQNSGGPGEPRNTVIENAKGEYIFFVDSDDYIHENSLDKMYNFAKNNDSEVLLVKMKGVNGRGVPQSMFKTNEPKVDLYESRLAFSIGPTKMFKTSYLREKNIYFPTGLKTAEDQIFTMRAYVNAKVISILSDQDYYYATWREGEHMNNAYIDPQNYFKIMSDILAEIYSSNETSDRKDKFAATFINRHFYFSRTTNFSINFKDQREKEIWMDELHKFLKNFLPESADKLTAADVQPRLALARNKDLRNYERFERDLKENNINARIENNQIYANFDCLNEYHHVNNINFTTVNKLTHKLGNIQIKNDRITFSCHVKHTVLSISQNESQQVTGVLVHRETKAEKFIIPIMLQPKTQTYTFDILYEGLLTSASDLGTWDLFIESKVGNYTLRGRIGNKREKYQYEKETSFIGYNNLYPYRLTPYFTKPYDNFSLYAKKLDSLEGYGEFKYNRSTKQLCLHYSERCITLPQNSRFIFTASAKEYSLSPDQIIWHKKGTIIYFNSPLIAKERALKNIKFNEVRLNNTFVNFKR